MMTLHAMTESYAKEICGWKYDGEYSVYNYPDWETCRKNKWNIADRRKLNREFRALVTQEDGRDVLCGFLRLTSEDGAINLGLGLRPDLCGRGLGVELMTIAINEYKRRFPRLALELDVRPFNKRAITCYMKSGFVVMGRFTGRTPAGETEFLHMRYSGK